MSTYAPVPPAPEDTPHLFRRTGGLVENPHVTATAIMAAMVTYEPSDWASLAKHLGTDETTVYGVSDRLELVHGLIAAGPSSIGSKLDAIAEYWSRYHAKAIRQQAEAMYGAGQDEHGFNLRVALGLHRSEVRRKISARRTRGSVLAQRFDPSRTFRSLRRRRCRALSLTAAVTRRSFSKINKDLRDPSVPTISL